MKKYEFRCDICNVEKTHRSSITTGYGLDAEGRKVCFACCADRDRAAMVADGHSRHLGSVNK